MSNIDEIMHLINWDQPLVNQSIGIRYAGDVKCLKAFFQPLGPDENKAVWGNCAKIICSRSDIDLQPYALDMLLWLRDINWPGADDILQRILSFENGKYVALELNRIVPILEMINDDIWLHTLGKLLSNSQIRNELTEKVINILENTCLGF